MPDRQAPQPGHSPDHPLPTLDWPGKDEPASWWGTDPSGRVIKVYRSYKDYCDG